MQIVQEEEAAYVCGEKQEAEQRMASALLKQEIIVARSQGLHIEGSKLKAPGIISPTPPIIVRGAPQLCEYELVLALNYWLTAHRFAPVVGHTSTTVDSAVFLSSEYKNQKPHHGDYDAQE